MALFRFSRRAEADLLSIGAYTLRNWGELQTIRYLDDLDACCQRVANHPGLGRACGDVRPGLRRIEHGEHVIFYRQQSDRILISRILHKRMLPEHHAVDEAHRGI